MKNNRILIAALVAASVGAGLGAAGYGLLGHEEHTAGTKGKAETGDAHREGEAHKEVEEAHGEEGGVTLNDARVKAAGITVERAGTALVANTMPLPGEIRFNQDSLAEITPRVTAVIIGIHKNVGDKVRKGDVLATLESQALAEWRSEYLANEKRLELARGNFEREKRLWRDKISAEQEYLNAKKELAEIEIAMQGSRDRLLSIGASLPKQNLGLARYELRAPFAGTIVEKHATTGEAVKEDVTLFQIADLNNVWAEIAVYPKNINQIQLDQSVTVRSKDQGMATTGKIAHIGALIGEKTRTATARITIDNARGLWRPGMFVNIDVADGSVKTPVAVKANAVQTLEGKTVVFIREGEKFEPREIEPGRQNAEWVEVIKGLKAGEAYASNNSYVVKAEMGKATASHAH
ncbi:efflux RND transporter periplasmic adaptor subunit [Chitinimonas arctica]|uniref:Efflux RND transporter periplasmic adaptor subunit n=1 Tax=Chitinimonas arctica TaxID=2594795 RepID=A0A516SFU8_9NEIS|nr:efflux RND transporter periplasmic adaptor subunit [Chitinimonas arctica]QDQ27045.1 efflux RND transporter periplasmic adaptor subunit [Chitinimonas arctica]